MRKDRATAPVTPLQRQGWRGRPIDRAGVFDLTWVPRLRARQSWLGVFLMAVDFQADAEARYADAVSRRDRIARAWADAGSPLLSEGSTGQTVEHPLVKMLRDHDVLVDRLAAVARGRHAGPAPSAVIRSSIGASPASRLRVAK